MRVIVTEAAWSDMRRIGISIAERNEKRANSFVDELYNRCRELGDMPRAFAFVRGQEHTGIRRCVHGNYLIFYRVSEDTVDILHILHGAMDYEKLLFPED